MVIVIPCLEGLGGTMPNAEKVEMLVILMEQDLISQELNCGIQVTGILLMVSIKGQLGICEQVVNNGTKKVAHPCVRSCAISVFDKD